MVNPLLIFFKYVQNYHLEQLFACIETNAVNTANTAATALLHHFGFSLNEVTKHADGTTTASFIIPVEEVTYNDAFKKSLF